MALFKCKMCGGALEINNNETVVTCEYCGTQQILECECKAEPAQQEVMQKTGKHKKVAIITASIVCAVIALIIVLFAVIIPTIKYNNMMTHPYTDVAGQIYDLSGVKQGVIFRTMTLGDEFTAEFFYALMENEPEEEIIRIMDEYGADQGGGVGHLALPNDYVEEVDEWLFANNRKKGDMAIIENVYGYTICYVSEIIK